MNEITEEFILHARIALAIQRTRIALGNRIYAYLREGFIRNHKEYPKLLSLRKDKKADRKKTAEYTKKLLVESLKKQGLTMKDFQDIFTAQKRQSDIYQGVLEVEHRAFKKVQPALENMKVYQQWLTKVRGIGKRISIRLLTEIRDIRRFSTPSKLCAYFGLTPGARKRRGVEANFNPKLKGFALGVIGKALIIRKSQYKPMYDKKKAHYHEQHSDWSNGKCHNFTLKAMVRRFMTELWMAWYKSLGLEPPRNPYIVDIGKHELKPMIVAYEEGENEKVAEDQ